MSKELMIQKRKALRISATVTCKSVRDSLAEFDRTKKLATMAKLKSLLIDIGPLNDHIASEIWNATQSEADLQTEFKKSEECHDQINFSLVQVEESLKESSSHVPEVSISDKRSILKQPVAPFPTFHSKEGENLDKFFRHFEATVSKFNYSDWDKLELLKQQVKGRASILINSLEVDKQTYNEAKVLLTTALASPVIQRFNICKEFSEMHMSIETDPFEYMSQMKNIIESAKNLNLITDEILQYFFWQGMNETFKNQLILITNTNKPSLKMMLDHFFEASERYMHFRKNRKYTGAIPKANVSNFSKPKNENSVNSFAANVNYTKSDSTNFKFKPCVLCTSAKGNDVDHPIYKCAKYIDPNQKLARLKEIRGCLKCSSTYHRTDQCNFSFRRKCLNCNGEHFSFLCQSYNSQGNASIKKFSKSSGKIKDDEKETHSGVIVVEVNKSIVSGGSILPTFSCSLGSELVRGMKDSGCQSNFITTDLAHKHDLKIIKENIDVQVNGFNSSKRYNTNLVELPLKFDDKVFLLEAISIPNINTDLKLPTLGRVVKIFKEKGYNLADKFLSERDLGIGNLNLILGTDAAHCLMEKTVSFGENPPSVYYETDAGIMLAGNVNRLLSNIDLLPKYNLKKSPALEFTDSEWATKCNLMSSTTAQCPTLEFIDSELSTDCNITVLNDKGEIDEGKLKQATEEILNINLYKFSSYDQEEVNERSLEVNDKLVKFTLENSERDEEGRLVMPLMWNGQVAHLLGNNQNLAKKILHSNFKKLSNKPNYLKMVDDVFKEQELSGIVERIGDLDQFLEEHPEASFLSHMGIFKLKRETTKCRVVFLSNLAQKTGTDCDSISHNQAMRAGPCLNRKLSTALTLLRFDEYVLCYDLKKAFNQIALNPVDQNKLLFLWFKNIEKENFEVVAYKNLRLSFGLKCSPTILMLGLFKILMLDAIEDNDDIRQFKRTLYDLIYVDNGGYTTNDVKQLNWAYEFLPQVFEDYKFNIQQCVTNNSSLQARIDQDSDETTLGNVKLFGLKWNREDDTLSTQKLNLNENANTKRSILSSIASNFDPYNFVGPLLNRSRLFMHKLQCNKTLGWDTKLGQDELSEWRNIVLQVNNAPEVAIKRFVGRRDSTFKLIAFTDSSKVIYGSVIFIQDLNTREVSFLSGKNRIVNRQLETKTIPSLEFQAVVLGVEQLQLTFKELCGTEGVNPINVAEMQLFTDSMVALNWIESYVHRLDKMQKRSVFIMNRLESLVKLCKDFPIKFSFVSGIENPADLLTRPVSHKILERSNYLSGPEFLKSNPSPDFMEITVPNPMAKPVEPLSELIKGSYEALSMTMDESLLTLPVTNMAAMCKPGEILDPVVPVERLSSFHKLVHVHKIVLKFVNKLKLRLKNKDPIKFKNLTVLNETRCNMYELACKQIIQKDQQINYAEEYKFFNKNPKSLKDIPALVNQLNLFMDDDGILRVKSKFGRGHKPHTYFPILLSKQSILTKLIVLNLHKKFSHAGCYSLMSELRKQFWIPHYFSVVSKILRECTNCRRFNNRTIKLNQSAYRDTRMDPEKIPFRNVFVDHFGPFWVKRGKEKVKAWILIITCLWSRAINLKICWDMTVESFLRAFQLHIFEYGIPSVCLSDLGSQLVAGSNLILDFLKDSDTQEYFEENGMKSIRFEQYFKGNSTLGSLVESCVKMSKRLIYGSIKNYALEVLEFEFFICQVIHMVNRRPIAFKEALRDNSLNDVPDPITPENLIRGYDLVSLNIIPNLQHDPDPAWMQGIDPGSVREKFLKLNQVRENLKKLYHGEFLGQLVEQAIDKRDRYKPSSHQKLKIGDIVLLTDPMMKPSTYPMGKVVLVQTNEMGEVTGVSVLKGKTREVVKRHVSSIIPLLTSEDPEVAAIAEEEITDQVVRPVRKAAIKSKHALKALADQNLI